MQPMQPRANPATAAGTANPSGGEPLVDRYWVGVAGVLRRYSLLLSEAWYDGIYLTAWVRAAIWAPLAAALVGLLEGIFHVSFAFELALSTSSITFGLPSF